MQTTTQLAPSVVAFDKRDNVTNMITFDDIARSINPNFSTYN